MSDVEIGAVVYALYGSSITMVVGGIVGVTLLLLLVYWFIGFVESLRSRVSPK